jgi:hypothetical protein
MEGKIHLKTAFQPKSTVHLLTIFGLLLFLITSCWAMDAEVGRDAKGLPILLKSEAALKELEPGIMTSPKALKHTLELKAGHTYLFEQTQAAAPQNSKPASAALSPLILCDQGVALAVIVTADHPGPTAEYAVKELVEHVRKATGVTLPTTTESAIPDSFRHRLFIGTTQAAAKQGIDPAPLADDAFLLRTIGPDLYVLGNDDGGNPLSPSNSCSGTLFGVYEILERFVGVRWLWPGELGTYVPAASSLHIGEPHETIKPQLRWNCWYMPTLVPKEYDLDRRVFLRRHRESNYAHTEAIHFFGGWWEKYGEKHPEWFQLNSDGTRGPGPWSRMQDKAGCVTHKMVHPCLSNKELQQFIVDNYAPKAPIFLAKGPSGKPAVHFSPGSRMAINGFANDHLAGKSFTVMVNSVSDTPGFGLCGNRPNGSGGAPRLYLTPALYAYDALADAKGQRMRVPVDAFSPGKESVYAYLYDAPAKVMRLYMNGTLIEERQGVETANTFMGGALAIPFKADGNEQDGFLLDLAIFDHALSASQIAAATTALQAGTALQAKGLKLRVAAQALNKQGADGKAISLWPSKVGPSLEASLNFDVSNPDNPEYCQCADCFAMDGPQPENFQWDYVIGKRVVSDRYAKFWQLIYERAKEKNPDVRVVAFLYRETFSAPLNEIKLNKNIIAEFTPHVRKTMFFPMPEDALAYMKAQWLGWEKTGMTVGYRPNYFNGGYVFPFLDISQSAEFLKFACEHGMAGWSGDTLRGSWAVRGPMLYVHLRLLQNPSLSIDAVLGEYYSAFGPAAGAVARYFDYWEKFSQKITQTKNWPGYGLASQVKAAGIYTPEVMAPAQDILQQAKTAVQNNANPEFARRVQFLQDGLQEASLTLKLFGDLDGQLNPPLSDKKAFLATVEARRQLVEFQRQHAADYLSDYQFYETNSKTANASYRTIAKQWQKLDQTLAAGFEKSGGQEISKVTPWAPWQFRKDPEDIGVQKEWFRADNEAKGWTPIQVPAFWSATALREYYGYAWCRTSFQVPAAWQGESISLTFGAVDEQAWVYVNGILVAEHSVASEKQPVEKLWNQPFAVEINPRHLKYGAVNSLVVRIHNAKGDGGIYRAISGSTVSTEPLFSLPSWQP